MHCKLYFKCFHSYPFTLLCKFPSIYNVTFTAFILIIHIVCFLAGKLQLSIHCQLAGENNICIELLFSDIMNVLNNPIIIVLGTATTTLALVTFDLICNRLCNVFCMRI